MHGWYRSIELTNPAIKIARQNGWISVLLGSIYPLYIAFMAIYIRKNHPKEDILDLSKKIYGNTLGNILNLIFLFFFFIISTDLAAEINNILKIYMIHSLNFWNLFKSTIFICSLCFLWGIKVIGKINEIFILWYLYSFFNPFFFFKKMQI